MLTHVTSMQVLFNTCIVNMTLTFFFTAIEICIQDGSIINLLLNNLTEQFMCSSHFLLQTDNYRQTGSSLQMLQHCRCLSLWQTHWLRLNWYITAQSVTTKIKTVTLFLLLFKWICVVDAKSIFHSAGKASCSATTYKVSK